MNPHLRHLVDTLRSAGYPLVQIDAPVPGLGHGRGRRLDILAWGPDESGHLRPTLVVEVKSHPVPPDAALSQMAVARDVLGTRHHYVVAGETWYEADAGLRTLRPVDGPLPPEGDRPGVLTDFSLAKELLQRRLWELADNKRNRGERMNALELFTELTRGTKGGRVQTGAGDVVAIAPDVLWSAARGALDVFTSRGEPSAAEFVSPIPVADAVAALVGAKLAGDVEDSFCGGGGFLWSVADRAVREGRKVRLHGTDVNQEAVRVAQAISELAPVPTDIGLSDAFSSAPQPTRDVIVTAPPAGLRLNQHFAVSSGEQTRDGELAAVDLAVRALRPGGRAVLHLSAAFTYRSTNNAYRRWLGEQLRVAALIGLPAGGYSSSSALQSVLLVLDKGSPGETFVAQLAGDWREQLSAQGAALHACLAHLDASTEVSS